MKLSHKENMPKKSKSSTNIRKERIETKVKGKTKEKAKVKNQESSNL